MKSVTLSVTKCLFSDVFPPVFENFHCGSEKAEHIEDLTPRHLKQTPITQTPPHIAHFTPMMSLRIPLQMCHWLRIITPADPKFITELTQLPLHVYETKTWNGSLAYVFCESNTSNAHVCFWWACCVQEGVVSLRDGFFLFLFEPTKILVSDTSEVLFQTHHICF